MSACGTGPSGREVTEQEPESMRRLQALKAKIQAELEAESKARQQEASQEATIPLSLAQDYAAPAGAAPPSPGANRRTKGGRAPRPKGDANDAFSAVMDQLSTMKLDKFVQRELQQEYERQFAESTQLKAQNDRLREIVALRQQSNARKEASMQHELARLSSLCDEACVDVNDLPKTLQNLRSMNRQIQEGADQLKAAIESQAEAERLQLVRSYRVKIREVKQMLHEQKQRNTEGAQNWIERYQAIRSDQEKAATALQQLQDRNERLVVQNRELEVMLKHQADQREALTTRVAVVKRENKRLQEHIAAMESQLAGDERHTSTSEGPGVPKVPPTSRVLEHTASSQKKLGPTALVMEQRRRAKLESAGGTDAPKTAEHHRVVLKQLHKALENIRGSLRQVRSAHVELLQERTELEVFTRQCMEDVRRDIYRFTVVSNAGRGRAAGTERVLENYTAEERKQLLGILQSKLRVFVGLHSHMFPEKRASDLDVGLSPPDLQLTTEDTVDLTRAQGRSAPTGLSGATHDQIAVEESIDGLWDKWKRWTQTTRTSP